MALKFFNSFGNKLEEFKPIKKGFVGLYTCGPTIYDFAHIGNLKCYVWEDLLKRYLIFKGFEVKHVMNYTDVDDKTIRESIKEKIPLTEYTDRYRKAFLEDVSKLNILPADVYCAATQHIPQMVDLVTKLLEVGVAYKGEDESIYFSIKKFPNYGLLSGVITSKLKSGVRIREDEYLKEGVGDFALWKAWSEDDGTVFWLTSLGKGRPGWHIECSAMSMHYLGEHFDIHAGGVDNKFPHHENEIAQSEAATGKKFVNYWLHTAHLMVDGQKMSKSLGNFYTLRDLLQKGFDPRAIRLSFINNNYRQSFNFTFEGVRDSKKILLNIQNFLDRLRLVVGETNDGVELLIDKALFDFEEAMDNDLNVPTALAIIFEFIKKINKLVDENKLSKIGARKVISFLERIDSVFGVIDFSEKFLELTEEQSALIGERSEAKKNKNWVRADEIREELRRMGVELIDNKDGSVTPKKI